MPLLQLMSWNMNQRAASWKEVLDSGVDVALLQEANHPPATITNLLVSDCGEDLVRHNLPWCATVAGLSNRVRLTPIQTQPLGGENPESLMISRPGTIAAAIAHIEESNEDIVVVSWYSKWATPISQTESHWLYADASAHRLISDLSALIGRQRDHKIIVAGDMNILYGYGENGSNYWKRRYDSVFERMDALGFRFMGPQAPDGGGLPLSWPKELPADSLNVPTFRTKKDDPTTAMRQLDYVFASNNIADRMTVWAANQIEEWGPSDHCRIFINLERRF